MPDSSDRGKSSAAGQLQIFGDKPFTDQSMGRSSQHRTPIATAIIIVKEVTKGTAVQVPTNSLGELFLAHDQVLTVRPGEHKTHPADRFLLSEYRGSRLLMPEIAGTKGR